MTSTYKAPATLVDELGIQKPSDIRIEDIAQYCGATVVYAPIDGCEARILGVGNRAIITVNSNAMRERQRFSTAHELGHWMRDRGKIAFSCTDQMLLKEWGDDNPERRANRYAADLLLPQKIFASHARTMPATFASARALAASFETSVTATAIRLVEIGPCPSMIICSETSGRRWFARSPIVPSELWPTSRPGVGSIAAKLLANGSHAAGPVEVDANEWIDHPKSSDYTLIEDSVRVATGTVLTIIWWKNEQQLLDLGDDEDD